MILYYNLNRSLNIMYPKHYMQISVCLCMCIIHAGHKHLREGEFVHDIGSH